MQRSWTQPTLSQVFAPAQENSVSESSDRSHSPISYNYYEADHGNELVNSTSDSSIADFWCVTQV